MKRKRKKCDIGKKNATASKGKGQCLKMGLDADEKKYEPSPREKKYNLITLFKLGEENKKSARPQTGGKKKPEGSRA